MRNLFKTRKRVATLLAVGVVAAIASVGAYAYFTSSGSGAGTANAGSTAGTVDIVAAFSDGIVPGTTKSVSFKAKNTNPTSLKVTTIAFDSVDSSDVACNTFLTNNGGQFHMVNVSSGSVVPANTASPITITGSGTLSWDDSTSLDQTVCAGVPLTLHVTSS